MAMLKSRIRNLVSPLPKEGEKRSKTERLKQQIVREALLGCAGVAMVGVLLYSLTEWASARTAKRDELSRTVSGLSGSIGMLQTQLTKAEKSLPLFEKLFKDAENLEIELDRRSAKEVLEKLREEYTLSSLRVSMEAVRDMEEAAYKTPFAVGHYVDMELSVEALSDEHVINFLKQLRQELPGKVKIKRLTLSRLAVPDTQVINTISQSGKVALVGAEVELVWMGVKPPPAPATATPPPG